MLDIVKLSQDVLDCAIEYFLTNLQDDDIETDFIGINEDVLPQIKEELAHIIYHVGDDNLEEIARDINNIDCFAWGLCCDIFGLGDGLECDISDPDLRDAYKRGYWMLNRCHVFGKQIIIGDDKKLYLE